MSCANCRPSAAGSIESHLISPLGCEQQRSFDDEDNFNHAGGNGGAPVALRAAGKPLPIQDDPNVPLEANDIVYARKLLSVISLESATDTPINSAAPIVGAGAMTMTMAVCPPGQGPSLHAHHKT